MDTESKEVIVSLNVICKEPHLLTKVSEVLSRAGMGLALEGLMVNMNMSQLDGDQEEVEGK